MINSLDGNSGTIYFNMLMFKNYIMCIGIGRLQTTKVRLEYKIVFHIIENRDILKLILYIHRQCTENTFLQCFIKSQFIFCCSRAAKAATAACSKKTFNKAFLLWVRRRLHWCRSSFSVHRCFYEGSISALQLLFDLWKVAPENEGSTESISKPNQQLYIFRFSFPAQPKLLIWTPSVWCDLFFLRVPRYLFGWGRDERHNLQFKRSKTMLLFNRV